MAALLLGIAASGAGCAALNENPSNDRFWFPTLRAPSAAEKAERAKVFPEGGDPYMNADVGPRSLATRPIGWTDQRSFPAQVNGYDGYVGED